MAAMNRPVADPAWWGQAQANSLPSFSAEVFSWNHIEFQRTHDRNARRTGRKTGGTMGFSDPPPWGLVRRVNCFGPHPSRHGRDSWGR